ncbi:MAG: DinB family protein [Bacteroidota bacterium]
MIRPLPTEHPAYFTHYIDLVKNDDVLKELKSQIAEIKHLMAGIPQEKENFVYSPGKWSIKEVLGHIIDTERIMAYRALCFARKDKTKLPGFDQNAFVSNANFNDRTLKDLAFEFAIVRESNLLLFKHFSESGINEIGNSNGSELSVRAIIFMIAGHTTHHVNVIKSKYLML